MLRYKILIPVLAQTDDFARLLRQIPDKEKLIIINNLDNPAVAIMCEWAAEQGAEIKNYPHNLGCAASWNIGLRLVDSGDLDYIMILSPSCRWNNTVDDFVAAIEEAENTAANYFYRAVGQFDTDTHAFAVMKKCVDEVGLFDENFHPVYFEDADYFYRQGLLGIHHTRIEGLRSSAPLGGGVHTDPRPWRQWQLSAERSKKYYCQKWGGNTTREVHKMPFGQSKYTIKDWTVIHDPLPLPKLSEVPSAGFN